MREKKDKDKRGDTECSTCSVRKIEAKRKKRKKDSSGKIKAKRRKEK